jgi:acyl carrier protein
MWDHFKAFLKLKPAKRPNPEAQKLVWDDAHKIESKVRELIAEGLDVNIERVTPGATWYPDLGASLDIVEVFMMCEEVFDIEIPDEDAQELENVGMLTAYIQRKLGVEPTLSPQEPWEKMI